MRLQNNQLIDIKCWKTYCGPVLSGHGEDIESFDIAEISRVVGNQRQAVGSRCRRDPRVVHGDGSRPALATDGSPFTTDFQADGMTT